MFYKLQTIYKHNNLYKIESSLLLFNNDIICYLINFATPKNFIYI